MPPLAHIGGILSGIVLLCLLRILGAGKRNAKIAQNPHKLERPRYDESHASRASHTAEEASISRHQSTSKNSSYGISKSTVVELEIQERKG
jgi:hypothetical protein